MAVDEEQDAAVEIAEVQAAGAKEGVVAVIGDVKARNTGEDIGEGAVAVAFDLVGSDDGGGGNRRSVGRISAA